MKQIIHGYGKHLGPCKPLKAKVREMKIERPEVFADLVDGFIEEVGEASDAVPVTWAQRADQLADAGKTLCGI
ncbi:MAG: hypothetical protein ACYTGQ_15155 [Planctomycetota bacterium]